MQPWPDTRDTLLARLRDPADRQAWAEFALIYEPLIYRVATKRGLQDADARDVSQRVMWTVARAADIWQSGNDNGKFRGWLAKVTTNAAINLLSRDEKHRGAGGSAASLLLLQQPDEHQAVTRIWEYERQLQLFRFAAKQVKQAVDEATWQAFWLTSVDAQAGEEVAGRLGKSVGAVYAARCRVLAKIRRLVRTIEVSETYHGAIDIPSSDLESDTFHRSANNE